MTVAMKAPQQNSSAQIIIANRGGQEVGVINLAQEQKKKRNKRKLPKTLTPQMIDRLFRGINMNHKVGPRNRAIFETMLKAGLRVAEVCALVAANVDLEERVIRVQNGKGGVDRNVPIRAALLDWLRNWAELRPQHSPYFFCTSKGTKLSPRYLNKTLQELSEQTGVYLQDGTERVTVSCHKFRHTCATNWLREGFNLPQIQRLLGHKDINTTMIYISVGVEDLKKAMFKLDKEDSDG